MQRITFELKNQIDYFYKQSNSWFAYASFIWINLFESENENYFQQMWENAFVISYKKGEAREREDQHPIISVPYLINTNDQQLSELKKFVLENNIEHIEYLTENEAQKLEKYFEIYENEERTFEVIYSQERFKNFTGIKGKKSIVNSFLKKFPDYRFVEYEKKHEPEVLKLLNHREVTTKHPSYDFEEQGIRFVTENYEKFENLIWFLLFVWNKIAGFSFGEIWNNDTFISYFMKGDNQYKWSYQAIQYLIANHKSLENIKYFNYTNLTSIPWIKEMKLQLKPEKILKSYVAIPKKEK